MNKLKELGQEHKQLRDDAKALFAQAKTDSRDLTEEEKTKVDAWGDRLEEIQGERDTAEANLAADTRRTERFASIDTWATTPQKQITALVNPNAGLSQPQITSELHEDDPKRGFKVPREFLSAVMQAGQANGQQFDHRLKSLVAPQATVGSDEQSTFADPYGGFLIPKGFSPDFLSIAAEADPLAGRTTNIPMELPTVDISARVDKNHSNSVSGGLRVYRRAQADTSASSRMEIEQVGMRAHSLFGLAYATEELLSQSPTSFLALLEAGFKDEFAATILDERLNGSGVGQYEGVLNTPCLVSITKETGQIPVSLVYENVIKMRARCWRYGQAIWLANHDTLPQLMKLTVDVGTGGVPVWQPSAREGEPEMLLGRPIFFTEFCEKIGTKGDILLGTWSQYLEGTLEPFQQAESIHVRFIQHERCMKFWVQNDGRPWWRSALTPKNDSPTLSPFVVVDDRT